MTSFFLTFPVDSIAFRCLKTTEHSVKHSNSHWHLLGFTTYAITARMLEKVGSTCFCSRASSRATSMSKSSETFALLPPLDSSNVATRAASPLADSSVSGSFALFSGSLHPLSLSQNYLETLKILTSDL